MRGQKAIVAAWIVCAGLGAWLQLAAPDRILGLDAGGLGFAIVFLVALAAIYALRTWPRSGFDESLSPGEWRAWGSLSGSLVILACVVVESGELMGVLRPGDLERIGRRISVLLLVIAAVAWMVDRRWKQRVQSDERDRDIAARAAVRGRATLAFAVFALVMLLAGSPAGNLAWASHMAIAHLLVYAIVLGFVVEYGYAVARYVRDRLP